MDIENLKALQETQLSAVLQTCEMLDKFHSKIKPLIQNLQKTSQDIVEHIENGDVTDQKRNSELWHELNNIEHKLKQICRYTVDTGQELPNEANKLIEVLRSLRPPKNLE